MSGAGLFGCGDPGRWRRVSDQYWAVVEAQATARKGKHSGHLLPREKW